MAFTLARRAHTMNLSVLCELLKIAERPGIISFAGGMPSPESFPVQAMRDACERVLTSDGRSALQYASSEGLPALREWVAHDLRRRQMMVNPDQVLITSGSQQALDLIGKVLLDPGSRMLVETPTYLGALQAFAPMEPAVVGLRGDEEGVDVEDLRKQAAGARMAYLQPNFQNPTGRCLSEVQRARVAAVAQEQGLPLVEDDPYGDLWFRQAPPAALTSMLPQSSLYLGSFSKVLAPGLRLGYVVAPASLYPRLLQAKQAADLHTPSFNQRVVAEVLKGDFMARQLPRIRSLYQRQCQVMLDALASEMADLPVRWNRPDGGMFLWLNLPPGMDASRLLPHALEQGVAFVPGAAFYASQPCAERLRLCFVTCNTEQIRSGIAALSRTIREHLSTQGERRERTPA